MGKNIVLGLMGITLFFLVITVIYALLAFTKEDPEQLQVFMPLIVFTGFFIFLIGAILVALYMYNVIEKR